MILLNYNNMFNSKEVQVLHRESLIAQNNKIKKN